MAPERLTGTDAHAEGGLDDEEIRAFLEKDYRRLVAGLGVVAGDPALAEEAVQEALARAWATSRRGEHIRSLKAWVAAVAMNILRSRFRRLLVELRSRRLAEARPGELLSGVEERLDVVAAVRALPRRQRDAVVLRYFVDLDIPEVARVLGTTEGATRGILHRARQALAGALQLRDPEEEDDVAKR